MKLYMMVEVKDNLTEKQQEKLCWDIMEATDVYSITCRNTLQELKDELDSK